MTIATLARQAADRDAALAEGLPEAAAYDPEPEPAEPEPEQVTVTIPGSGPRTPDSTVTLARLDYTELRRLRGEGLAWAELKRRFKLPGQVLRAVAGDVDPHQGAKDRAAQAAPAPERTTARQQRATGSSIKRRRAATYDENVAMARRVHAGESPAAVAAEFGFAVSTVQATYRWATREQLLDVEEANR